MRIIEPLLEQLRDVGGRLRAGPRRERLPDDADPTSDIVEGLGAKYPRSCRSCGEKQGGMGWDMRSGFDAASGTTSS